MSLKSYLSSAIVTLPLLLAATPQASADTFVYIHTSDNRAGAGTDSNVWIKLFGPEGETKRTRVQDVLDGNILESGETDILFFTDKLGPAVTKIEIESDGRYPGSDWHLEKIVTYTGKQSDVMQVVNPWGAQRAIESGKVVLSTFVYDDWIRGEETFGTGTAGRVKNGVQLTRKEAVAKEDGSGENVSTNIFYVMMSDGLDGNRPVAVSTVHTISRSESMSVSTKNTNSVKSGVKAGVSYSSQTATGGEVEVSASVSLAYDWAKEQTKEQTWTTANSTTTEDKFAADPGTFEFRILESNGTVTIQKYKSLLSNENFVVSYLQDASSFAPRGVTFVSGEPADAKWNRSVALPLAVSRGEAEYNRLVRRLKKFDILKNPISYAEAVK